MFKGIYINGIKTEEYEALKQAERLEEETGIEYTLRYSPTICFLYDLLVAFYARWFGWFFKRSETRRNADYIRFILELEPSTKIHAVAHSRGCVVLMNSLNILPSEMRSRIYVTLFAATNFYEAEGLALVETFLNDEDFVISNLVLGAMLARLIRRVILWWNGKRNSRGPIYIARGSKHSLIEGYLERLERFSGYKESFFYKLKTGEIENEKI